MYLRRRPIETFEKIVKILRFCARLLGADVLDPNYRVGGITCFIISLVVIFFAGTVYTISKFIADDWTVLMEIACTIGGGITGVVKLLSGLLYTEKYHQLHNITYDIYKKYQHFGVRYEVALEKSCARTRTILRLVALVYIQMVILTVGLPLVIILINGKRYPAFPLSLPGLDVSTDFGYWGLYSLQATTLIGAGFGLYAGDMFIIICLTNFLLYIDILKLKIQDLNEQIEKKQIIRNDNKITEQLNDIVQWHQSYFGYTDMCNSIFFWILTVQTLLAALTMLSNLFVIMYKDWPGAYAYFLYGVNSLYEYCLLGTRIEICNDQFCDEIYAIKWYDLNISQQKIVYLMLIRSHSPETIDIGGVLPLSVSTALAITRNIYSTCMMLLQFQD